MIGAAISRRSLIRTSLGALVAPVIRLKSEPESACEQISSRMAEMEASRQAALKGYEVKRRYSLQTRRAEHCAEMEVQMAYEAPGRKYFQVLWEAGSSLVQSRVFRKLMDAEQDAARDGGRDQVRISPQNYSFLLVGNTKIDGRPCYVLDLTPRTSSRYLVKGRAWVDAEDFAVVRIEGSPAQNPSFWLRKTRMVQQYHKIGPFWLPYSNETDSEVRLFGAAQLRIQYHDYRIQPAGRKPIIVA